MTLPKYPKYKKTDVKWLGDIPSHWEVKKLKYLFDERNQKGFPTEPLLAATQTHGVITKKNYDKRTVEALKDLEKLKLAVPGDFVISLRSFQGGIEYTHDRGIISPAYNILIPLQEVIPSYFCSLFKSQRFLFLLSFCVTGIREGQNINFNMLRQMKMPLPKPQQQKQIASFLDVKCAQINRLTQKKKRLISLLKEYKQAVIHQAVTRGLDPNVPLKPTGVEWLGDIPEHWKVRRLKFMCRNLNEQTSEKQSGEVYIALEHVESWTGRVSLPNEEVSFESQVKRFQFGDVLFGKLRPYLAKVTMPQLAGVCVSEFLVLRANEAVSPPFLEHKLRSKCVIDLINSSTFGAKMPRADWTLMGNLKFAYPPVVEQQKILEHIGKKCVKTDQSITRAEREIELMNEYRTRLISDVVTGQIDVRHIDIGANTQEEHVEEIYEEEPLELVGAGHDH